MTVDELITLLMRFNDDMTIKYSSSSEGIQMDISSVNVEKNMLDLNEDIIVIQE